MVGSRVHETTPDIVVGEIGEDPRKSVSLHNNKQRQECVSAECFPVRLSRIFSVALGF